MIWDVLEEPPVIEHSCLAQCGAKLFGTDMMGLPSTRVEGEKAGALSRCWIAALVGD